MTHSVVESLCWSRCQRFVRGSEADENYFFIGAVFSSILLFLSSVRLKVVFYHEAALFEVNSKTVA